MGDTWYLDDVFVTIQGQRHYLWRAVDQEGDVIDILVRTMSAAGKKAVGRRMKAYWAQRRTAAAT